MAGKVFQLVGQCIVEKQSFIYDLHRIINMNLVWLSIQQNSELTKHRQFSVPQIEYPLGGSSIKR